MIKDENKTENNVAKNNYAANLLFISVYLMLSV